MQLTKSRPSGQSKGVLSAEPTLITTMLVRAVIYSVSCLIYKIGKQLLYQKVFVEITHNGITTVLSTQADTQWCTINCCYSFGGDGGGRSGSTANGEELSVFSSSVTPFPNMGGCPSVSRLLPVFARKTLSPDSAGRQAAPQPFLLLQPGLSFCLATYGALLPSAGHQLPWRHCTGPFQSIPRAGYCGEREGSLFFFSFVINFLTLIFLIKVQLVYNIFLVSGMLLLLLLNRFSRVQLCATPQMAVHQAPLSLGFSGQEYWSGLPFSSPMVSGIQHSNLFMCMCVCIHIYMFFVYIHTIYYYIIY